jgi:hypothetical protein
VKIEAVAYFKTLFQCFAGGSEGTQRTGPRSFSTKFSGADHSIIASAQFYL